MAILSAALVLAAGCAGRAANEGNAGGAGAGSAQAGAEPAGMAGANCTGTLEEVNALGGPPCPTMRCAANVWANDCKGLPETITRTYDSGSCGDSATITLEQSGVRSKVCYYKYTLGAEGQLTAVEAWDSSRSECGGHVTSADVPTCELSNAPQSLCDRASQDEPKPANNCFSAGSSQCIPCCVGGEPDCSQQVEGYHCLLPNSFYCVCSCVQGRAACGC